MTTLCILIHEPEQMHNLVEGIANAICPYLGACGAQASIASTERLRELRNGDEVSSATMLRVALADNTKADFTTVMTKLQRFLKQAARDADVEVTFELWRVEVTVDE